MMLKHLALSTLLFLFSLISTTGISAAHPSETEPVSQVLNKLHASAAAADGTTYFSLFSENAIFFGTDIKERWTVSQFKEYAMPIFKSGKGWTYKSEQRNIFLSADKKTAWFDEILNHAEYGKCRGTGVLIQEGGTWRIAQYHLTLPIPNEIIKNVVGLIRTLQSRERK